MSLSIHQRMAILDGNRARAEYALAALEAVDPHAALGISGRRLQKQIEEARTELKQLRDVLVCGWRAVGRVA